MRMMKLMNQLVLLAMVAIIVEGQIRFPDLPGSGGANNQSEDDALVEKLGISVRFITPSSSNNRLSGRCTSSTGKEGTCGPFSQCPALLALGPRLSDQNTLSFLRSNICRVSGRSIHLCCEDRKSGGGFFNPQNPLIGENIPPGNPRTSIIPSEDECGSTSALRILEGSPTEPGSWPWLVGLGTPIINQGFQVQCGGSLITRRHVLSAAHCFAGPQRSFAPSHAILGEYNLNSNNDGASPITLRITNEKTNGYNDDTKVNDIIILELEREVSFNDHIRPACLPFNLRNEEFQGQRLDIVGWGATVKDASAVSNIPLQAKVSVVSRSACQQSYTRVLRPPVIDEKQLCAGEGGADSCQGDSGGPLNYLQLNTGKYYIVGVVSFGVGCGRSDYPGVYTRVGSFIDWIVNNVQ